MIQTESAKIENNFGGFFFFMLDNQKVIYFVSMLIVILAQDAIILSIYKTKDVSLPVFYQTSYLLFKIYKMRKKLIVSFLICFSSLYTWAGKVVPDSIQSTVLGSTVLYNVYLPDGFETAGRKFPVVYLLHGLSNTYRT